MSVEIKKQEAKSLPKRAISVARLDALLSRSQQLYDLVNSPIVSASVGKVEALPSVPRIYLELRDLAAKGASAVQIAEVVAADPVLSLKLLQLVNSVAFGMRRRVASVPQAVALLGVEQIKGIVLTAQVFANAAQAQVPGFSLDQFQDSSMRIGRIAQRFMANHPLSGEAFTAGLLSGIGKLVLAMAQPGPYTTVLTRVAETGEAADSVEREVLGVTHSEVGAYLLWEWGLPVSTVECVAFHHRADLVKKGPFELIAAVHAADALYDIMVCGEPESRLDKQLLERAGLLPQLDNWRDIVRELAC